MFHAVSAFRREIGAKPIHSTRRSALRLVALIDFGDATILDRHWDLGSALDFHGDQDFSEIFTAYSDTSIANPSYKRGVKMAMHAVYAFVRGSTNDGSESKLTSFPATY